MVTPTRCCSVRAAIWRSARATLCASLLTAGACGPDVVSLNLRGTVTDQASGEPVVGAVVLLLWTPGYLDVGAVSTESGSDGHYVLSAADVTCDDLRLIVRGQGYQDTERTVACTGQTQHIDFELAP